MNIPNIVFRYWAELPLLNIIYSHSAVSSILMTTTVIVLHAVANNMSRRLLEKIQNNVPDIETTALEPVQCFKGVTEEHSVICELEVKFDVLLRIRHGSSLILRNIVWKLVA